MPQTVKLVDNAPMRMTFKYGNCAQKDSQNDDGSVYYSIDLADDTRVNLSEVAMKLIYDAWPGRGGSLTMEKLNATRYEISDVEPAEKIYPLELKRWNNASSSFEQIDWPVSIDTTSSAPKAPAQGATTSRGTAVHPTPSAQPQAAVLDQREHYSSLAGIMSCCVTTATEVAPDWGDAEKEKIAVALFIQCTRDGLTYAGITQVPGEEEADGGDNGEGAPPDDGLPF